MKRGLLLLLVVGLLGCWRSIYGQQSRIETRSTGQVRVIDFEMNQEIKETSATRKYVATLVGPKNSMGKTINVFDRSGNQLMKKSVEKDENINQEELSR